MDPIIPKYQDEGQEVRLIQAGLSVINSRRPLDTVGLDNWIKSIQNSMPQLVEEHQASEHMSDVVDAFAERYLNTTLDMPGYVIIKASVLTKLTVGGLLFDKLIEVIPQVHHMIETVGFCPVLHLYHIKDYTNWDKKSPYLGRIRVVDFNQLFYQT